MSSPKKNVEKTEIVFVATDLAWAAGILDADGNVYGHKTNRCTWQFGIEVGNTDSRMIQRLFDLSGKGHVARRREKKPRKDFWTWRLSGLDGKEFIRALRPYLVVKQDQLNLLLELIDTGDWRGKRIPASVLRYRMEIIRKLKALRHSPNSDYVGPYTVHSIRRMEEECPHPSAT
jgi:hypothetical protein